VVDDGYKDQAVELLGDHKPWGPLRGGKYSAYEAGTRVPFIVSWPKGGVAKGADSHALVSHIDLFATLAALTGQTLDDDAAPDSFDQLSVWLGKDNKGRDYVIEQASTLSVVEGYWKYIATSNYDNPLMLHVNIEPGIMTQPQLYNLKDDIGERTNLAAEHPDKVDSLASIIEMVRKTPKTR
jgi:arylsulfatase A-like enzyme